MLDALPEPLGFFCERQQFAAGLRQFQAVGSAMQQGAAQ
ncbi:Uncharacterised protein [Mycobacterium tuberculosis]|nr:Uncharacterised protein [Mycobacterium tuberculosis]